MKQPTRVEFLVVTDLFRILTANRAPLTVHNLYLNYIAPKFRFKAHSLHFDISKSTHRRAQSESRPNFSGWIESVPVHHLAE